MMRTLSLRGKLIALSMTCTGVALLVACVIFLVYDYRQIRNALLDEWMSIAKIVAGNSTAAVAFNDAEAANNMLRTLSVEPELENTTIYLPSGEVLARYVRPHYDGTLHPDVDFRGARLGLGYLEICQPIRLDGKQIGLIYIRSDLHELYAHMRDYFAVMAVVFAGTMLVAYVLVIRLQRVISIPISNLTRVARKVAVAKDYSLRAGGEPSSSDELSLLVNCFDQMLAEIQQRDAELAEYRAGLEREVAARTGQLQQTLAELTGAKQRAEEASAAKTAFLANMSHEIRTPMTAIIGYADSMLEPDQTVSDRQDALQTIRRNGQHLLELINDILDISKIEADRMTVERVEANLPSLLADLISLMRPRAVAKGLGFRLEVMGAVPQSIHTDPLRLRQVLINILANAVKFTERGEVCLCVRCTRPPEGPARLCFEVRDTGIGIAPDQVDKLFRSFAQADGSTTRRFGGTGLGLVISKRLALLLGGDVSVQSKLGQGSTFTVCIDAGPMEDSRMLSELNETILPKPALTPAKIWKLAGRILLVEDGVDNQRLISMHLTKAGAEVSIAANGRVGVDMAAAAQSVRPFDLILMDMQMPELDGYSATSELRRRGFKQPIIALTAHALLEDRDKCLAAGCSDYLSKPIEKDVLLHGRRAPFGGCHRPRTVASDRRDHPQRVCRGCRHEAGAERVRPAASRAGGATAGAVAAGGSGRASPRRSPIERRRRRLRLPDGHPACRRHRRPHQGHRSSGCHRQPSSRVDGTDPQDRRLRPGEGAQPCYREYWSLTTPSPCTRCCRPGCITSRSNCISPWTARPAWRWPCACSRT